MSTFEPVGRRKEEKGTHSLSGHFLEIRCVLYTSYIPRAQTRAMWAYSATQEGEG